MSDHPINHALELQPCGRRHEEGGDCGRCTAIILRGQPVMTMGGIPVHVDPNAPAGVNPVFPIATYPLADQQTRLVVDAQSEARRARWSLQAVAEALELARPDGTPVDRDVMIAEIRLLQADRRASEARRVNVESRGRALIQLWDALGLDEDVDVTTEEAQRRMVATASKLRAQVELLGEASLAIELRRANATIERLQRDLHNAETTAAHADTRGARIKVLEEANLRAAAEIDRLRSTVAALGDHGRQVMDAGNANASAALLGDRRIAELEERLRVAHLDRETSAERHRDALEEIALAAGCPPRTGFDVVVDVVKDLVRAKPWAPDYGRAIAAALGFDRSMSWADALKAIQALRKRLDEARPGLERLSALERRVDALERPIGIRLDPPSDESPGALLDRLGDDASAWADEFMRVNGGRMIDARGIRGTVDAGYMTTWFANAIEHGHDVKQRRARAALEQVAEPVRIEAAPAITSADEDYPPF